MCQRLSVRPKELEEIHAVAPKGCTPKAACGLRRYVSDLTDCKPSELVPGGKRQFRRIRSLMLLRAYLSRERRSWVGAG